MVTHLTECELGCAESVAVSLQWVVRAGLIVCLSDRKTQICVVRVKKNAEDLQIEFGNGREFENTGG